MRILRSDPQLDAEGLNLGAEVEMPDIRARSLVERGYCEPIEEKAMGAPPQNRARGPAPENRSHGVRARNRDAAGG